MHDLYFFPNILMKIFKQTAKLKEFYGEHLYTHHLDFTLVYLLCIIYILSLPSPLISPSNTSLDIENFLVVYIIKYEQRFAYTNFFDHHQDESPKINL